MKLPFMKTISAVRSNGGQRAKVRIAFVIVLCLIFAAGALAFQHFRSVQARKAAAAKASALSGSTETVLNGLKSPVELRFYSLLDPASTSESLRAFSERVNRLLAEYEKNGNGKIRIVRIDELTDANAEAAAADGIRAFNRDKGEACYLGIAAVRDNEKESIAEISPDWEQALESDLSRTVSRVNDMVPAGAAPANVSDNELKAATQAIASNPNLASASLEQGTTILRDAAMAEFKTAVAEMQSRTQEVEQNLSRGAISGQDATDLIKRIRDEETAKIQSITGTLHDQLAALAQVKSAGH
jgi:predicted HicB family RNase H-like nuclease